jgi:hypothetical protein
VSHLLISYLTSGAMNVDDPKNLIYLMPALLMLCIVAGFILLKIPTMTASLFSGHTGGHGSGMGEAGNEVEKVRLSTCRRSFRRMVQSKAAGVSSWGAIRDSQRAVPRRFVSPRSRSEIQEY